MEKYVNFWGVFIPNNVYPEKYWIVASCTGVRQEHKIASKLYINTINAQMFCDPKMLECQCY